VPTDFAVTLVDAVTADGVRLSGAFLPAHPQAERFPAFDAVLMMHGVGGNFAEPFFRFFAEELSARGCATLRANNRGHDIVSRSGNPAQPYLGAAYEHIADCVLDWRAWTDVLADHGYRRILLFGHSLGAVKSAWYLAHERDTRIRACVLASPPRFTYTGWMASPLADTFAAHLARAQALVDAGDPMALFPVTMPYPSISGAHAYLDKYGPEAPYDVFRHVPRIAIPVLAFTGERELRDNPLYATHVQGWNDAVSRKADLEHHVVPGGDHFFTDAEAFVLDRLLGRYFALREPSAEEC
jgi:pimeloyl-ACP methyl ester carboxylesterase